MGIALQPEHLRRYRDIARLLIKYGRSDLVSSMGVDSEIEDIEISDIPASAADLANDLEAMGPTYIKLGQLLSARTDLLPPPYIEVLSRLQDNVGPFSFEEVERTIVEELGVRISKAFSSFDAEPLAAASLGQVHRAMLRDGTAVAVKVQRPNIRSIIATDLEMLSDMAGLLEAHTEVGKRYGVVQLVEELRQTLVRELDYRKEAANLERFAEILEEFPNIHAIRPIQDYSTSRVLTMEFVDGRKITDLSPLVRTELNTVMLAEELFRAYLKQILVDGFVHADPHPGNVLLTRDGKIALIDLGMVARVPPQLQTNLIKILLAVSEGRGEDAAELTLKIGNRTDFFDSAKFIKEVSEIVVEHQGAQLQDLEVGRLLMRIAQVAGESGVLMPSQLSLIGKALLSLDHVGRTLDPAFDPTASIRRNATDLLQRRVRQDFSMSSIYNTLLETNEFFRAMPRRLNEILDLIARNQLQVHVDAIDETKLIQGMQKIANRITLGVILASLVIGAALMMRIPTTFTLFGYPGLAIILFLIAAGGGLLLALSIVFGDEHGNGKRRRNF